jgi:BirA family biotin operon repressor/biotin-[acetyl-CoA-carboxylase] ligase
MMATDLLTIDGIRRRLVGDVVGLQLYLFGEVDSTNAKLRTLARGGAREGTVVLAEGQTAGRGRRGQPWFSPSGVNLYASVLFRPALAVADLPLFSLIPALAVVDAVKDCGLDATIKWPNDVLVDGKKVAGSLVEAAVRGDVVEYVIVGVGVNLNVETGALQAALGPAAGFATSLAAVAQREIDRNAFTAAYLNHLDAWVAAWRTSGSERIRAAWADREILTGRRVVVRGTCEQHEGRALGIDEHGRLVVRDPLGHRRVLTAEEVRLAD